MAEPKTAPTGASVDAFIDSVPDDRRRADSRVLLEIMRDVTGCEPEMWGPNIVGFGRRPLTYADGSVKEWMEIAFSPRKANFSLYIMAKFDGYEGLLGRLGPHKTGASCLYVNRLAKLDMDVLREIVERSISASRDGTTTSRC